jgi:hypothetical protein
MPTLRTCLVMSSPEARPVSSVPGFFLASLGLRRCDGVLGQETIPSWRKKLLVMRKGCVARYPDAGGPDREGRCSDACIGALGFCFIRSLASFGLGAAKAGASA